MTFTLPEKKSDSPAAARAVVEIPEAGVTASSCRRWEPILLAPHESTIVLDRERREVVAGIEHERIVDHGLREIVSPMELPAAAAGDRNPLCPRTRRNWSSSTRRT